MQLPRPFLETGFFLRSSTDGSRRSRRGGRRPFGDFIPSCRLAAWGLMGLLGRKPGLVSRRYVWRGENARRIFRVGGGGCTRCDFLSSCKMGFTAPFLTRRQASPRPPLRLQAFLARSRQAPAPEEARPRRAQPRRHARQR